MTPAELDDLSFTLEPAAQMMLAAAIVIMIFAISLGLKREHFLFLRSDPKLFWGGVAAQIIGLPVMTLVLILVLAPPASIALGMIVVAACPGGNVSNFMTWGARGDLAYSISLTAASSIIAAVWTPAAILFWSGLYPPTAALLDTIDFDRLQFVLQTTVMLAGPLLLGMICHHYFPAASERLRKPLALFGAGMIGYVIIAGVLQFWPEIERGWMMIYIPVIVHNALAFGVGAGAGRLLGASDQRRRTLAIEVGIQNAGLAVVLLLAQLQGLGGAAAVAAAWGVWHFFSGGLMILLYRYIDRRKAAQP